jgi:exodeoxyribonuclease VII small subunit
MSRTPSGVPPEIAALSFEEALDQLEKIVAQLEQGRGKLDEAIESYERGAQLKAHCEAKLAQARERVEKIMLRPDGSVASQPLDPVT